MGFPFEEETDLFSFEALLKGLEMRNVCQGFAGGKNNTPEGDASTASKNEPSIRQDLT